MQAQFYTLQSSTSLVAKVMHFCVVTRVINFWTYQPGPSTAYFLEFSYQPGPGSGTKTDFWLLWGRYILGIEIGTRLVLPQVPTRLILVQGWYCLRSYQTSRVCDAIVDTRHRPIYQTNIGPNHLLNNSSLIGKTGWACLMGVLSFTIIYWV
jgi:hypothetical protein